MKKVIAIPFVLALHLAGAQSLTVQDAINIALKKSLDIQLQKNNVAINTINNNIGMAGGLPLVSASATDNEQSTNVHQKLNSGEVIQRSGAAGNTLSSGITAGMLLYNGARVVATKQQLDKLELQSEQVLNSLIQNTMASVMTGYYDVVRQQAYLQAINESVAVAREQLKIVRTQQSVGMANDADLFQSQINLNNLEQQQQSQQLVIDQAKTGLLLLLNLRPDSSFSIMDTVIDVDPHIVLGNILDDLGKNADIVAADEQVSINQLIVKETAAQRYPSLRANAGYNYNRSKISAGNFLLNESNGPFAGVSLTIPIYNGSIYKRQQQVATINVRNAELQKDILIRDYRAKAVQTYQAYASSLQQLDSQRSNVTLARKLIDLVLYRFRLHQATIVELTQAQQSFQQAAYAYTNISFAAKSSEIELKRLVNEIPF